MADLTFYYGPSNFDYLKQIEVSEVYFLNGNNSKFVVFSPLKPTPDSGALFLGYKKPDGEIFKHLLMSDSIFDVVSNLDETIERVIVANAHLLTSNHVEDLLCVASALDIPVSAYGARVDFQGSMYDGSIKLLSFATKLEAIPIRCHCGKLATMSLKLVKIDLLTDDYQVSSVGPVPVVERNRTADKCEYKNVCYDCWRKGLLPHGPKIRIDARGRMKKVPKTSRKRILVKRK